MNTLQKENTLVAKKRICNEKKELATNLCSTAKMHAQISQSLSQKKQQCVNRRTCCR